jgi:hypothetical protein
MRCWRNSDPLGIGQARVGDPNGTCPLCVETSDQVRPIVCEVKFCLYGATDNTSPLYNTLGAMVMPLSYCVFNRVGTI